MWLLQVITPLSCGTGLSFRTGPYHASPPASQTTHPHPTRSTLVSVPWSVQCQIGDCCPCGYLVPGGHPGLRLLGGGCKGPGVRGSKLPGGPRECAMGNFIYGRNGSRGEGADPSTGVQQAWWDRAGTFQSCSRVAHGWASPPMIDVPWHPVGLRPDRTVCACLPCAHATTEWATFGLWALMLAYCGAVLSPSGNPDLKTCQIR